MQLKNLLFVGHCILNTCAKVVRAAPDQISTEEAARRHMLELTLQKGVQIVQLPCPEFTLYGPKRWGHVKDQFDNVFFRQHCRHILQGVLEQMLEYSRHPEQFRILAVVGVEGSPSCGVNMTCRGDWGGEFSGRENLNSVLAGIRREEGSGVLTEVLREMLAEAGLEVNIIAFSGKAPQQVLTLLQEL